MLVMKGGHRLGQCGHWTRSSWSLNPLPLTVTLIRLLTLYAAESSTLNLGE